LSMLMVYRRYSPKCKYQIPILVGEKMPLPTLGERHD
jgi:hypothetical protein